MKTPLKTSDGYEPDVYDLKLYPPELRSIIRILMRYEDKLSDGFEWYATVEDITKIAESINKIRKSNEKSN
jgi:hypothetical protein